MHPELPTDARICRADLARFRRLYLENLLKDERGRLSDLDREVLESLETGQPLSAGTRPSPPVTFGEAMADRIANFGGSWTFLLGFLATVFTWMVVNVVGVLGGGFDPYPFILLNLVLSCLAAIQAPVIMMSQRRQEAKDRQRSESDYQVNLKAELEIRALHEKLDHQWDQLVRIQQAQIELMEDALEQR
ncbi:DUF1003 domain-containing protein [Histidinibacterium aquaticum]|uniref:DUF1003 domain-containing protein n=2 Tax=Histidinibacterium aquaticum TaxID=2613962 RepID=A0A5J5GAK4_9RHOB|nr:DUF1003 domain-containing protein [Histidinibacterium aquaticum]